jgi:hypothetical protein
MPSYEDFKVGDVWVRRDGKEGKVDVIDEVDKTILVSFVDAALWYFGSGRSLCKEDKYDLIRKKDSPCTSLSIAARIAASQARVEGMKAKNYGRESNGEALAYDSHDFFAEAQLLEQLANEVVR